MENFSSKVKINSLGPSAPVFRAAAPSAPSASPDAVTLSYLPADDKATRDRYYGKALQSPDLYQSLNGLLGETHTFSMDYSSTLKVAPFLNLYPDGTMHCVYTGAPMAQPSSKAMPEWIGKLAQDDPQWHERWGQVTALAGLAPEAMAAGTAVLQSRWVPKSGGGLKEMPPHSLEHMVPQSWFDRMRPMRSDLHILSPVENSANSARGNLPISDKANDPTSYNPQLGKGEVARATLYFLLRYPGMVGDQPGEYTAKDLPKLLEWHQRYPVTDFERHRNAQIQQLQGNRNPLVDFPELAGKIDFSKGFFSKSR